MTRSPFTYLLSASIIAVSILAVAIGIIGLVVSGSLGSVKFGPAHIATPGPGRAAIRVALGLNVGRPDDGLQGASGGFPDVRLWNEAGQFLGTRGDSDSYIESGGFGDIEVVISTTGSGQQPTYALFTAADGATCIAYAAITWPGGDQFGFDGSWGKTCGQPWYFSNYPVSATEERLTCTWIDADNETMPTGFQIHWPDFAPSESGAPPADPRAPRADARSYLCGSGPPLKYYRSKDPDSILYWMPDVYPLPSPGKYAVSAAAPDEETSKPKPRHRESSSSSSAGKNYGDCLVVDDAGRRGRDPRELCESPTSSGPDFVGTARGTFCRMSDKTLWPVCSKEITDGCFDVRARSLIVDGEVQRESPYKDIIHWSA